jgi:hypothetical protein
MKIVRPKKTKEPNQSIYDNLERYATDAQIQNLSIKEFIPACPIDLIKANPWNPNEQDAFQRQKTRESLRNNGFVHNLVVREVWKDGEFSHFQLLDGEHRTDAARDEGIHSAPVNNLGIIPESKARKLALVLAANRGELNPKKLGKLISELEQELTEEEFSEIPFDDEEIEKLKSYYDVSWREADAYEIFHKTKEISDKAKVLESNLLKINMLIPRHNKEKIAGALDKYAIEHGIKGNNSEERRGKVIQQILFKDIYPELSKGRDEDEE